ncbi:hypothetical protein J4H92_13675 [Leucobacter weissii]|uniref:Uncharacterized protein n=1 Tax=Leucobacter weissii TaxID=1983706 RepID=A0A939MQT5_9MICO|nr:hypothetical protein [Leucobacter weissii]MBO1902992.1 hypothetical protein [Leucobacter weissii]
MSESTRTTNQDDALGLSPEAGIAGAASAFSGVAGAASAESAEIINLLNEQEAGGSCCGGSCCSV